MAATQVLPTPTTTGNQVTERAARNWAANSAALDKTQPATAALTAGDLPEVEWLLARDGALTAMLPGDRWWQGCSVPLAAARVMLRQMEIAGNVACFLSPVHAAQLHVALEMLEARQAVIALVPDRVTLWVMLHCRDFSEPIASHRLWFAAGPEWEQRLARLFVENPGLPTPAQFVRPILADPEHVDQLIAPAQKVFAAENTRRGDEIRRLVARVPDTLPVARVCLVAPSRFRLWDCAPQALTNAVLGSGGNPVVAERFDSDDSASASPLALASAIARCGAIVSADLARTDVPDVAPTDAPWVTWVTTPRIPSGGAVGPRDSLLLADPSWRKIAVERGWPADRVHDAAWPQIARADPPGGGVLALVADTQLLKPPKRIEDYSSHKLLWEGIADELLNDPFAIGNDPEGYLREKTARSQIDEEGFDRKLFLDRLITPAWQQGLARLLIREALPLRLWGKGWDEIEPLAPHAAGAVTSADAFDAIVTSAAALVHPLPSTTAHPIDSLGCPVLRAFGRTRRSFLHDARQAQDRVLVPAEPPARQVLGPKLIARLLG